MAIRFFAEKVHFKIPNPRKTANWIAKSIKLESRLHASINIIFTSDASLLELNRQYLNHNTLTDIITFDYPEQGILISGDIYISIDRVRENATEFNVSFNDELHRVIIHGILHLIGYTDKTKSQKTQMRNKEDYYLSLRTL